MALPCMHAKGGHLPTGRGPAAGTAAGREDARLREVVLGEILDARPSTRWDDVAGLQAAKQARWAARVLLPVCHEGLSAQSSTHMVAVAGLQV